MKSRWSGARLRTTSTDLSGTMSVPDDDEGFDDVCRARSRADRSSPRRRSAPPKICEARPNRGLTSGTARRRSRQREDCAMDELAPLPPLVARANALARQLGFPLTRAEALSERGPQARGEHDKQAHDK